MLNRVKSVKLDLQTNYKILPADQRMRSEIYVKVFNISYFCQLVEYFTTKELFQVLYNLSKELTKDITSLESHVFITNLEQQFKNRLELFMPEINDQTLPSFSNHFLLKMKLFRYVKINTFAESLPYVIKYWHSHFTILNQQHAKEMVE